jgi:hypothetical protein
MDHWASRGTAPPANQVPTRAGGPLVPSLPQSGVGFPSIPGVTYGQIQQLKILATGISSGHEVP